MRDEPYSLGADGIHRPVRPISHRNEEYDETLFEMLQTMQRRHFWYRGRHRFLLHALRSQTKALRASGRKLDAIDLGGGCGGWIGYLQRHWPAPWNELALADSSCRALDMAARDIGPNVTRYQIDLLDLGWKERWDVAFLLDVVEHIPDHAKVMQQVHAALRPGGLLFVTTPALQFFWSYNDVLAHHVRRYSRADFAKLATETGFELPLSRYFMFFLSPLLFLARRRKVGVERMKPEEAARLMERSHRVPPAPLNELLAWTFAAETPLGSWLPFPWGTSVLGVFRKPGP